jgi:hypothetical protein
MRSLPPGALVAAALLVLGMGAGEGLHAQTPGRISGEVVHRTLDTPMPGVEVQLGLPEGPGRTAVTGPEGGFLWEGLPPGTHRVRIRQPGFHPLDRTVELGPGESVRLRLELTPIALDLDTIRVLASPLTIRRTDTEFTARIDRRVMEALPTAYDPQDMVLLAPGAAPGRIWGGAADEANLYQLDGMIHTHPGSGGPLVALSPAWLEAVEVRGLGAGAEHGAFQGGIVNAVTRTGTNLRTFGIRSSFEHRALNATNLVDGDVGRERAGRMELEVDGSGPLVRDRLFYFFGTQFLTQDVRAQSRLPGSEDEFLPHMEERREVRGFGKLTWTPSGSDRVDLAGGFVSDRARNWGLDGFRTQDAAGRRRAPASFYHGAWRRGDDDGYLEIRAAGAESRETIEPDRGVGVPGIRLFAPGDPPMPTFQNAPFRVERRPTSHSLSTVLAGQIETGPWTHRVLVGAEASRSGWIDRRTRTGGMTWRAVQSPTFDADDPSTWNFSGVIPSDWGGEVDLHARMGTEALFIQDHLILHPRLSVSPGLRFARWRGDLLPGGDRARKVAAVRTHGLEPRIGITFDPLGTNELVFKAHWGRIHQNLLASFFDRAEGGEVFSNRELWYYRGEPFQDPGTSFTPEERDAMADLLPRGFSLEEVIRLNETGPTAANLRQPHVDQWLLGAERTFGPRIRLEALWVDRTNRNMIALQDRNLADNYHRYDRVRVMDAEGGFLGSSEGPLTLPTLYVPNDWIRQLLVWAADPEVDTGIIPPGFVLADTLWLSFEQDLELRNVPEATRRLQQLQLSAHGAFPSWGGSVSLVWSRLRGNFNSVTGYEAGTGFDDFQEEGAGPFVRPNEQVNFLGDLPGLSALEFKVAAYGELPWDLRVGAFFHAARGERFTPHFALSGTFFQYALEDDQGDLTPLDFRLIRGVSGQRILMQTRGEASYEDRVTLDLRMERTLPVGDGRWRATVDLFNVWNGGAVTRINPSINYPTRAMAPPALRQNPAALFGAVWERAPPRTLRLGIRAEL